MMKMIILTLGVCLNFLSTPLLAEKVGVAREVVSCINAVNGHVEPVYSEPWGPTQAELELPYEHERKPLDEGFYFVVGRKIGHHGTWAALLDVTEDMWKAYETRDQNDDLAIFGASFVPPEVVSALGECDVKWGGYWIEEYPIVNLDPPNSAPNREAMRLLNGSLNIIADLLPTEHTAN